jgi:hypothetical protein
MMPTAWRPSVSASLLIALTELKILSEQDARDLFADVATSHTNAALAAQGPGKAVQRILAGKDGVRH